MSARYWLSGWVLAATLLTACGSGAPTPSQPGGRPTETAPRATSTIPASAVTPSATGIAAPSTPASPPGSLPTPTPSGPIPGAGRTIALADDGRTVTMSVGDRFVLDLGEGYDWSVVVADPSVLDRVATAPATPAAHGTFEARKAGRTVLQADGDPTCRKASPPCQLPSRHFEITVVVS